MNDKEYGLHLIGYVDGGRQLIKLVYQNVAGVIVIIVGVQLPKDGYPEIAGWAIGPNVEECGSYVPKLFHLPTNFGTIAYLIWSNHSRRCIKHEDYVKAYVDIQY